MEWGKKIEEWTKNHKFSDIIFTVRKPPCLLKDGSVFELEMDLLNPKDTENVKDELLRNSKNSQKELSEKGACDFSWSAPSNRFRVNIFLQRGSHSIVMRLLSNSIPTLKDLSLPVCFEKMANEINGLILFAGATGTGKTTSLAAILNHINENRRIHCITLEDPIEYLHHHNKSIFNQRELGSDFDSFSHGLRSALRQAPHVILVGEIRDKETVEMVLAASETGHLVFSTIHTMTAQHTINRILSFFNKDEERQIRFRLADSLRWIVGQRLLPKKEKPGRIAIFDILFNNIVIKDLIINGERDDKTFYDMIEKGSTYFMQTFDQNILEIFEQGEITEKIAKLYAIERSKVNRGIDYIKYKNNPLVIKPDIEPGKMKIEGNPI